MQETQVESLGWEDPLEKGMVASQVRLVVKNVPANAGDIRDASLIHRSGRSPGEGHSNPLQYSCLENPMDGGAWQAIVHRVAFQPDRIEMTWHWVYTC